MGRHERDSQEQVRLRKFHSDALAVLNRHRNPFSGSLSPAPWSAKTMAPVVGYSVPSCIRFLNPEPKEVRGLITPPVAAIFTQRFLAHAEKLIGNEPRLELREHYADRAGEIADELDRLQVAYELASHGVPVTSRQQPAKPRSVTDPISVPEFLNFNWPLARSDWNAMLAMSYAMYGSAHLDRLRQLITASDTSPIVSDALIAVNDEIGTLNTLLAAVCDPLSAAVREKSEIAVLSNFELRASVFAMVPDRAESTAKLLCRIARSNELDDQSGPGGDIPTAAYITTNATDYVAARSLQQDGVCYSDELASKVKGRQRQNYIPIAVAALRFEIEGAHSPGIRGVVTIDAMTSLTTRAPKIRRAFKALNWRSGGATWINIALIKCREFACETVFDPDAMDTVRDIAEKFNLI